MWFGSAVLHPPRQLLALVAAAGAALALVSVPADTIPDTAVRDMEAGGYYTFVTILNLFRNELDPDVVGPTTFFMPSDHHLGRIGMPTAEKWVDLVRMHSVPSTLSYSLLRCLPNRTRIPTNYYDYDLEVVNADDVLRLNGIRVVTPDVCSGGKIACHGIEAVLERATDLPGGGCTPEDHGDCGASSPVPSPAPTVAFAHGGQLPGHEDDA